MNEKFYQLATEKIERLKKLVNLGYKIFDIDLVDNTVRLDKYIKVFSRGKIKNKRKIKTVKLNKEEIEILNKIAFSLVFLNNKK